MSNDEQLMERALERLRQLRDDPTLDPQARNANGLAYIIEDLEKRLKK